MISLESSPKQKGGEYIYKILSEYPINPTTTQGIRPSACRTVSCRAHDIVHTLLKHGSSVVRHLPLALEGPGSIPARGRENFGEQTRFL